MHANPYASTMRKTETPRQCEARALSQVNGDLRMAAEKIAEFKAQHGLDSLALSQAPANLTQDIVAIKMQLQEALDRNNQFWDVVSQACSSDQNELPIETRTHIIGLAANILTLSARVLNGEEAVETLIGINTNIISGLNSNPN